MSAAAYDDLGKLILRLSLGIFLLFHGISKLSQGVAWLGGPLAAHGLPTWIAYGVYLGEVAAPILIILGVYARLGAVVAAVNMLFAFGLMHMGQVFSLGKSGGWALELQGFYLFGSIALALLGAGAYSLGGRNGRWN